MGQQSDAVRRVDARWLSRFSWRFVAEFAGEFSMSVTRTIEGMRTAGTYAKHRHIARRTRDTSAVPRDEPTTPSTTEHTERGVVN
jgi:hypothetical protein